MSADIFRTSQLIIIMLNQKHSYLTFNKGGSKKCHQSSSLSSRAEVK